VYRMSVLADVPENLDPPLLETALEERGAELGLEVTLSPA